MKANTKYGISFLGAAGALLLLCQPAEAATRTAYFNQSGMNKTVNGLATQAQSICRITISNPSTQTQEYNLTASVSSLDKWDGGDAGTARDGGAAVGVPTSGATANCGGFSCSGSINQGASVQITLPFTIYPSRQANAAAANAYQKLRCSGTIVATDPGQPGFLIANGILVTFVESTKMSTEGVTDGNTQQAVFGGMAVYTQVPISINRGKPF